MGRATIDVCKAAEVSLTPTGKVSKKDYHPWNACGNLYRSGFCFCLSGFVRALHFGQVRKANDINLVIKQLPNIDFLHGLGPEPVHEPESRRICQSGIYNRSTVSSIFAMRDGGQCVWGSSELHRRSPEWYAT